MPTSPDLANRLYHAVLFEDLPTIDRLLGQGVDPNARANVGNGMAPLATLLPRRHGAAIVRRFVQAGVDLNRCDRLGNGVLFHTLRYCRRDESLRHMLDTVTALLTAGADLHRLGNDRVAGDCYSRRRVYPLDQAVVLGMPALVQRLLDSGANPNAVPDPHGWTALHHAAHGLLPDHDEVVRQLVRAGADADVRDEDGRSPLDRARGERRTALRQALDERRVIREMRELTGLSQDLSVGEPRDRVRL